MVLTGSQRSSRQFHDRLTVLGDSRGSNVDSGDRDHRLLFEIVKFVSKFSDAPLIDKGESLVVDSSVLVISK